MSKHFLKSSLSILLTAVLIAGCSGSASQGTAETSNTKAPETTTQSQEKANETTIAETPVAEQPELNTYYYDVIVVGSGAAGMTAAIEAAQAGVSVIIVEKMSYIGGNSNRASGGVNAAGTDVQAAANITDSPEQFAADMIRVGTDNEKDLLDFFVNQGQAAIDFCRSIGLEFSPELAVQYSDPARSHRDAQNRSIGKVLVPLLEEQLAANNIDIVYNTKAESLITDEGGEVIGITAAGTDGKATTIMSGAVILATGGYEWSKDLLTEFVPEAANYTTSSHSGATGDGIIMARELGAQLVNMDALTILPLEQTTGTAVAVTLRRNGMIYVNTKGERFVDEFASNANSVLIDQPDGYVWYIFNEETRELSPTADDYINMGICRIADSIPELAAEMNIDAAALEKTMTAWNTACETGTDELFGRTSGMDINVAAKGPYYAVQVSPGIHYTSGGLKINVDTQVINDNEEPITGLYAAGETTGGLHGNMRYTGNSVSETIIFGRQAGQKASAYVLSRGLGETIRLTDNGPEAILSEQGIYKDGTYSATANGMNGELTVTLEISNGNIISIATEGKETPAIFAGVEREMYPAILAAQSAENIDGVSGATYASEAVLQAVDQILKGAARE